MSLIEKELIKLVEDIKFAEGDILPGERKFTERLKHDDTGELSNKLIYVGSPEPGAKVEIYWKMFEDPDYGYIFTLPVGCYYDDISMGGIIHIPNPQGGEKCNEEPEWIHIDRLLELEECIKVKIIEDI